MSNKKRRFFKVFSDNESLRASRDSLVKQLEGRGLEVKYGDDFIDTEGSYHKFQVLDFHFPLANFSGYDTISCPDILDKLKMIVAQLEELSGIEKKEPEKPTPPAPQTPQDAPGEEIANGEPKDTLNPPTNQNNG